MSEALHSEVEAPSEEQLTALRTFYDDVDEEIGAFLVERPEARCLPGCHDCCLTASPLVSDVEMSLVERCLEAEVAPALRAQVVARAHARRSELEAGAPDDFVCPLLEAGRCLVYAGRPYLCRTYGHSARLNNLGLVKLYTCGHLRDALLEAPAPIMDFRSEVIWGRVQRRALIDSYLPIWLSTSPEQRALRWTDERSAVAVAANAYRVERDG